MFLLWLALVVFVLAATLTTKLWAARTRWPRLFHNIGGTLRALAGRWHFWLVLGGGAYATYVLAVTGFDWTVQEWFQSWNPLGNDLPRLVLIGGNFWHPALALGLLVVARIAKQRLLFAAAAAALQAVIVAGLAVNALKWLSGRRGPARPGQPEHVFGNMPHFRKTTDPTDFAFDFWNHGFADGRFFWPSGHTATAFAFAAAVAVVLYSSSNARGGKVFVWFLWAVAALTGVAMIDGDFHWLSDVLVGAPLGALVGHAVGKVYRDEYADLLFNKPVKCHSCKSAVIGKSRRLGEQCLRGVYCSDCEAVLLVKHLDYPDVDKMVRQGSELAGSMPDFYAKQTRVFWETVCSHFDDCDCGGKFRYLNPPRCPKCKGLLLGDVYANDVHLKENDNCVVITGKSYQQADKERI